MTRRAAILTNLLLSLPLTASLLCAAPAASAQTGLIVNVPFAFSANNHYMPAGPYQVQPVSDRFLSIRNVKTGSTIFAMVRPEQGRILESHSRLVFDRTGSQNYLKQVWVPVTSKYSELVVRPSQNQELAKQATQKSSTIEVASK